jgi:ATP-dependent Lon protease
MTKKREDRIEMPVLALRDVVVYPHMVIPLFVGREIYPLSRSGDGKRQTNLLSGAKGCRC